jgi:hypothetical protein
MAIYLISKIKPKNGTSPMVDAVDVEMPDGTRLSDLEIPEVKDGVSPTVTVTAITGGHRVTITDATGTKTFDVMDGEDGQGASITVDSALSTTSTNPIQNKAVAQRLSELTEAFSESIENVAEMIPGLDDTLSETGKAADAKAVGDAITQATQDVGDILQQLMGSIPTDAHINDLIDAYLSEALGGDY